MPENSSCGQGGGGGVDQGDRLCGRGGSRRETGEGAYSAMVAAFTRADGAALQVGAEQSVHI